MTLLDALITLHKKGKIATMWRVGMLVWTRSEPRWPRRVVEVIDPGKPYSIIAYGVSTIVYGEGQAWAAADIIGPEIEDECTVGALAALAREASGDWTLHAAPNGNGGWKVVTRLGTFDGGHDGEVWASVLIALAEEVGRG